MVQVEPQLIGRLRIASQVFAGTVCIVALAALTGWVFNIVTFKSVVPGLAVMKVNTALSLLALAAALIVRVRWERGRGPLAGDVLAVLGLALPLLTLVEWATGVDLQIDQFLFADDSGPLHGYPGRMSVATAVALALIGTAILLVDRVTRFSQVLAILCLVAALLGLLGYAYGVPYYAFAYSSMSLHTMGSLLLLATAFLMSRPRRCLHRLLISRSLGGKMARRLLPATIVVPLVVGWVRLQGQKLGYYGTEFGVVLFALANIIILAALVWWNARILDFSLLQKQRAEQDRDDLLVREQAARARAEKALTARDQLLAVVSHELRTPLTPVLLTAASLEHRSQLPTDVQDDVRMIREQIEAEAQLIDALLDLTSLQQGKITISRQPVDLNEVVRKSIASFGRQAKSHGVALETTFDAACPPINGDPLRLQQVAGNLLSNALKFTPRGGRICCRTFARNGGAVLEISDTGVGIDAEAMGRLFGPFEQGDPSTTRKFGGLGIGLAISRQLVDLHGGTITAASEGVDRGATFTVSLPRGEGLPPPAPASSPRAILLVDDNRATVRALHRLLQGHGHMISTAVSAKQGIEIAMTQPIDLIISDIGLPDLSGWEMMRQIRRQLENRGRRTIRGIAISGFVDNDDKQKSLECGFVAHLAKPIDVNQLIETVNGALNAGARSPMEAPPA